MNYFKHVTTLSSDYHGSLLFLFRFCCEACREMYSVESIQYRYRISVMASDRTQLVQVTVFGSCLDGFFGTSATSFMRFGCKLCNAFYLQVLGGQLCKPWIPSSDWLVFKWFANSNHHGFTFGQLVQPSWNI